MCHRLQRYHTYDNHPEVRRYRSALYAKTQDPTRAKDTLPKQNAGSQSRDFGKPSGTFDNVI